MRKITLGGAFFMTLVFCICECFAQCNEVKGLADSTVYAKLEANKVLYQAAVKSGQFKKAVAPLNWLLTNAPQSHTSLYDSATDVFEKLASQERNPSRRRIYVDSLMIVYDLCIKNCGDEASVLNRKVLSFVKYNYKPAEALALFDKVLELNGNDVLDETLLPYMETVKANAMKFKKMSDAQIYEHYNLVTKIADAKIKKTAREGRPVDKYMKIKDDIDAVLISVIKVDCEFVTKNLEPRFRQNPSDLTLAKKIFSFMLQGQCTDDKLWLEAGETIYNNSALKDFALAKHLGLKFYSIGNFEKAKRFLTEALPIASSAEERADVLISLGQIQAKSDKPAARKLFQQALEADDSNKEAYEKIGDLYYNSYDGCAKKVNQVDDRLVYLLAADYYEHSGNGEKVAIARQVFPSKEDVVLLGYKQGDTRSVGCWIEETTTIRTRD